MAELNLKQIIDRLNAEFVGDTRKLVFWYDDKAEFAEDMQEMALENAKVYFLQPDNQFQTKIFLERIDKTTNYLIYAPFPKPDVRDNHLEDTLLYSKRFFADRASLLAVDLGIEENLHLQRYSKCRRQNKKPKVPDRGQRHVHPGQLQCGNQLFPWEPVRKCRRLCEIQQRLCRIQKDHQVLQGK